MRHALYTTLLRPGVLLALVTFSGCATGGVFGPRPRPSQLTGMWVDSATTTSTDSVIWVLAPDGADRSTRITVTRGPAGDPLVRRQTGTYGSWYVAGTLPDTAGRRICFDSKGRSAARCFRFRLDTLTPPRRRLVILDYQSRRRSGDRVLLERP